MEPTQNHNRSSREGVCFDDYKKRIEYSNAKLIKKLSKTKRATLIVSLVPALSFLAVLGLFIKGELEIFNNVRNILIIIITLFIPTLGVLPTMRKASYSSRLLSGKSRWIQVVIMLVLLSLLFTFCYCLSYELATFGLLLMFFIVCVFGSYSLACCLEIILDTPLFSRFAAGTFVATLALYFLCFSLPNRDYDRFIYDQYGNEIGVLFNNDVKCYGDIDKTIYSLRGVINGRSEVIYPDSTKEEVYWRCGKPIGNTKLFDNSGDMVVYYVNKNIYESNGTYIGQTFKGEKSGTGTYIWKNGNKYEGDWLGDERTGRGTFTWANGDRYSGDFINNGTRTGKGIYTWATSGSKYEGDFTSDVRTGQGTYKWANGDSYVGSFKDGKHSGKGTYTWASGDRYEGDVVDNQRTGKGTYTWASGDRYEGDFVDNQRTGKGLYIWKNGDILSGAFVDGLFCGTGVKTFVNGDVYKGEFNDKVMHGQGVMTYENGFSCQGTWADDKQVGACVYRNSKGAVLDRLPTIEEIKEGKRYLENGNYYEGRWSDGVFSEKTHYELDGYYIGQLKSGQKSGEGTFKEYFGDTYTGSWKNGVRHGKGVLNTKDGDRYEGDFVKDTRTGIGVYTWANGNRYEGDFVDNQRTGKGVFTWADGDRYEGDFVDNQRTGKGAFTWADGDRYEGDFVKGAHTGIGVYTWANGDLFIGNWKDGKRVGAGVGVDKNGQIHDQIWSADGEIIDFTPREKTIASLLSQAASEIDGNDKLLGMSLGIVYDKPKEKLDFILQVRPNDTQAKELLKRLETQKGQVKATK